MRSTVVEIDKKCSSAQPAVEDFYASFAHTRYFVIFRDMIDNSSSDFNKKKS